MREMTKEEKTMYEILSRSQAARESNWAAIRDFYWNMYQVRLPELKGMLNVLTVDRMVRRIKSLYSECNDDKSKKIKEVEEDKYKEDALMSNQPIVLKSVATSISWWK